MKPSNMMPIKVQVLAHFLMAFACKSAQAGADALHVIPEQPLYNLDGEMIADYTGSYVAFCAIVKDQHLDLLEWIEWHRYSE